METYLRKVLCKDRLPDSIGFYDTNLGNRYFIPNEWKGNWVCKWWLEEVTIDEIRAEAWEEGAKDWKQYQENLEDWDCESMIEKPREPSIFKGD